jgi:hypothetical protein
MKKNRWQDWLNMLLGAWLLASPWLLKYADELPRAASSAWISGAAIALLAAIALSIPKAVEEIVNALLGVWVSVSPWVLGFSANRDVTTNAIFVGILVALLAVWAAEFGHDMRKWHKNNRHPA